MYHTRYEKKRYAGQNRLKKCYREWKNQPFKKIKKNVTLPFDGIRARLTYGRDAGAGIPYRN